MWTVAWELYHDFPTLRRMLLGASRFEAWTSADGQPDALYSPRFSWENLQEPTMIGGSNKGFL